MTNKQVLVSWMVCGFLLLAACAPEAPAPEPTQAGIEGDLTTPEPTEESIPPFILVTRESEVIPDSGLPVPGRGTLVASETQDPFADVPFDRIYVTRYGGGDNIPAVELEIFADGRYVRDGVSGLLMPEQVEGLNDLINEINFYGIQGTMLGPSAEDIAYRYSVTVDKGAMTRTINSQDQFMPQEYIVFLAQLLEIGFR